MEEPYPSPRTQIATKGIARKTVKDTIIHRKGRKKAIAHKSYLAPIKHARRYKPGTVALREIRRFQKTTDLLLPRTTFTRLVREVTSQAADGMRIQAAALLALQETAEAFLVHEFECTQLAAIHAKRVTITPKDMHLVRNFRRRFTSYD